MDDPGKDNNRKKIKIEHGKLIFRPQQKQQQNNIIPFPSFITNKTEQKRNENKTHKHKLTVCAEEWPIPVKTKTEKR
jgi:hypothetical protein